MNKRKAISKKIRFNVFKRDSFACQYCGSTPPNVVLEIDHINPVCLGGDNDIDNLITSCFDCNRGKSGESLSNIPTKMSDKASAIKESEEQIKEYNKILKKRAQRLETESWEIVYALEMNEDIESYNRHRLSSIRRFLKILPKSEVLDAAELTAEKFHGISLSAFRYFCGICWSKSREAQA